jgi:hypothetical protein
MITACTTKVTVPSERPLLLIEKRIPSGLVLVVSEDIRECSYKHKDHLFTFGPALCDYLTASMEKLFQDVQSVTEVSQATDPWDLALWLDPVCLEIEQKTGFFTPKDPHTSLKIGYKITDKNNKELFSSETFHEYDGYAFKEPKRELLASNESNTASDAVEPMEILIAGFHGGVTFAVPTGPCPKEWCPRVISKLIEQSVFEMVEDIREAYRQGRLYAEREALGSEKHTPDPEMLTQGPL